MDGDGDLDLLTANNSSATVSVRLNSGIGNFGGSEEVSVSAQNQGIALGDVDGDGDLDFVTANNGNTASVRLNNGAGVFGGGQNVAVGGDQPVGVVLGDVDRDGDLDLLVTEYSGQVSIRRNNGRGVFSGGQEVTVGTNPTAIAVGDLDGDGDLDWVTANIGDNSVSVRLNDGTGTFSSGQEVLVGAFPISVALGDVDGDGDLDLVTANNGASGTGSVRLNDGHGAFGGSRQVSLGSYSTGVALGDVDGDGDLDLVATYFGVSEDNGAVSVRLNDGTGTFSGGQEVPVGGFPNGIELGDVDGDGDLDLVTANVGSSSVSVRLNQPAPVITVVAPTPASHTVPRAATVAATFDQPLNTGPATRAGLKVFSQQAGGQKMGTGTVSGNTLTFKPSTAFKPGETVFASVTPAVQTRDNQNPAAPYVFQFTVAAAVGPGVFSEGSDLAVDQPSVGVAVGDVDGDGDLDLVTATNVRFNTGAGTFVVGPSIGINGAPRGVTLGDVDGDGDLDLLVTANIGSGIVNVRLNDGHGTFSGSQQVAVGFAPVGVAVGDVDGDGDLDLVTANLYNYDSASQITNSTASVRLNDGHGTFSGGQEVPVGRGARSVALGDVDGDGDLDLVTANAGNSDAGTTVSVRLNNGRGTFSGSQEVLFTHPFNVALGDMDGDGDLDLVVGNAGSSTASVRLNQASAPANAVYRLRAGDALATSRGPFAADAYFSAASATFATGAAIAGTADPALYQQERYSTNGTLSYALPVANGQYTVVLHFAEIYWTQPGQRVFDIGLEGKKVAVNYDIVKKVGPRTATTETFPVVVADGVLNLDLSVAYLSGGVDQAKLSALEVLSTNNSPQSESAALPSAAKSTVSGLSTYPNPSRDIFTLACTATKAQDAALLLTDPLGNTVLQQAVPLRVGPNLVTVRVLNLSEGFYQLTLRQTDGQHLSQRILIRQ